MSAFRTVDDKIVEMPGQDGAAQQAQQAQQQAAKWLVASLQVVSQRFVTGLSMAWHTTFTALLAFSAWWLWRAVLAAPDMPKLAGASIYSLFCLAVMWLRRNVKTLAIAIAVLIPIGAYAQQALVPRSSSVIEGSHVFCTGPCKLYTASVQSGASAGFFMVFDLAADPADGTLTVAPKYCWSWPANTSQGYTWPLGGNDGPPSGAQFNHGLTLVYSTGADCLHKTESATAFFSVQVQ